MNNDEYGIHIGHCCKEHGCKYMDSDCPVVTGEVEQEYPCEDCDGILLKDKVKLKFMVDPVELGRLAYIENAVKIKIIDCEAIFLTGILGESGRKLVQAGLSFYFEEKLARKLIEKKIAEEVK